jgi:molybdate transport system substrate-binding protein
MKRRLALALPAALAPWPLRAAAPVTVFAAVSLAEVLPRIVRVASGLAGVRFSFAASSVLARQIEQGAPAQVFVSADEAWMDHLQQRGLLQPGTRRDLAGNRLVVVRAGAGSARPDESIDSLRSALAGGKVATGDPAHVPVGRYAQAALKALGLWDGVAPRLVRADNVRSALAFVERGEADAGIVYATDAALTARVHVAARFGRASHPPIRYPAALVKGAAGPAARVLEALFTPAAGSTLRRAGFVTDLS